MSLNDNLKEHFAVNSDYDHFIKGYRIKGDRSTFLIKRSTKLNKSTAAKA